MYYVFSNSYAQYFSHICFVYKSCGVLSIMTYLLGLLTVFASFFLFNNCSEGPKHGKVVFCYLTCWSGYRQSPVKFDLTNIDPSLCTHLVYAFAILDEATNGIKSLEPWQDVERNDGNGNYKELLEIKKQNPHLKTIICVGGYNDGSTKYSKMSADPNKRKEFIKNVIEFLGKYEFDGLNLQWIYPTTRGGNLADKENLVTLIKELKTEFSPNGYILTAAVSGIKSLVTSAYDLVNLNQYLDFIYVIAYDYYGPWNEIVGPNSPLKGKSAEDVNNVEYNTKFILSSGVSPHKLVLGIPFYGRTFYLADANASVELGVTKGIKSGFAGPYIKGDDFYGYNEVCLDFKNKSSTPWSYLWDEKSSTPYLHYKDRVVAYENPRSIVNKVRFAMDYDIGGFFVWSIDTDSFNDSCNISNDTYIEYINRFFKQIREEPKLLDVLKIVKLPRVNSTNYIEDKTHYAILNGELIFKQPERRFENYPLLRTIEQAIYVAMEEKKFVDAMEGASLEINTNSDIVTGVPCVRSCVEVCFYGPYGKLINP